MAYIGASAKLDALPGSSSKLEDLKLTNEEMHRAMEFIIQQQAQYEARLEKDAPRLASLEESFKMLVELVRRAKERPDRTGKTRATLSHTLNELKQRTITHESRLASLEEAFKVLAELAHKHGLTLGPAGTRSKRESTPNSITPKKPPRIIISDAEFRRRLKQITLEWRKNRLAELRSKNSL